MFDPFSSMSKIIKGGKNVSRTLCCVCNVCVTLIQAHQPTKWNMFIILKLKRFVCYEGEGRKLLLAHTQILGKLTNDFFLLWLPSYSLELPAGRSPPNTHEITRIGRKKY